MKTTDVCPGTLASGFNTYSPLCLRKVFEGKKVSHIMDFSINDDTSGEIVASVNKISISGVQEKISAIIKKGKILDILHILLHLYNNQFLLFHSHSPFYITNNHMLRFLYSALQDTLITAFQNVRLPRAGSHPSHTMPYL